MMVATHKPPPDDLHCVVLCTDRYDVCHQHGQDRSVGLYVAPAAALARPQLAAAFDRSLGKRRKFHPIVCTSPFGCRIRTAAAVRRGRVRVGVQERSDGDGRGVRSGRSHGRGTGCSADEMRCAIETGDGLLRHADLCFALKKNWLMWPLPQRDAKLLPGPARGALLQKVGSNPTYVSFGSLLANSASECRSVSFISPQFTILNSGDVLMVTYEGELQVLDEAERTVDFTARGPFEGVRVPPHQTADGAAIVARRLALRVGRGPCTVQLPLEVPEDE